MHMHIYRNMQYSSLLRYSGLSSSWDLDPWSPQWLAPAHTSAWEPQSSSDRYPYTHTHYGFSLDTQTIQQLAPGSPCFPGTTCRHTHISKQVSLGAGSNLWSIQCLNLSQLLVPLVSPESTPQHPASLPPDCCGWTSTLTTNLSKLGQTPVAQRRQRNTMAGIQYLVPFG